jgi:hypothetical protein
MPKPLLQAEQAFAAAEVQVEQPVEQAVQTFTDTK